MSRPITIALLLFLPLALPLQSPPITSAAETPSPSPLLLEGSRVEAESDSPAEPTVLPRVTVIAAPEEPSLSGTSVLDRRVLERLPADNGSINEQLRVLPGIQLGEASDTSLQGGEILPPNLSIAGGRVYQNNFLIDGFDINSFSDPTFTDPTSTVSLPNHPQTIFLDPHLVEKVRIRDHNVSARYGTFTGGVVGIETRDPGPEFGGTLTYRTTRDSWTSLHVDEEDREAFENSHDVEQQPRFEKHDGGISFDLPLKRGGGFLVSYQRLQSTIPLRWLDRWKSEGRRLENFFGKYHHPLPSGDTLRLTLVHAPYEEDRNYQDSIDGDLDIEGENSSAIFSWEHLVARGAIEFQAGYRRSENRRTGVPYLYSWLNTPSRPWGEYGEKTGRSFEGGPGPLETAEEGWQVALNYDREEIATGTLLHLIRGGIEARRVDAEWVRPVEMVLWSATDRDIDQVSCDPADWGCIEGEQYFNFRTVFPAGTSEAEIDFYSAHLEDRIRYRRLEVRPGLRWSYDDFMGNHNWSPRLAASLDLFGDGGTLLIAGRNRYFGKTLLAYQLREESLAYNQLRSAADMTWGEPKPKAGYRYSELETPRTDETVIGLDQRVAGGIARLRYIEREGSRKFAREKDPVSGDYILNNNGSSDHEEYRFAWERWWRRHYLALNVTYQKTRTSNEDYSETFDTQDMNEQIWYEGEIIDRFDQPRLDFNRPWIGNLVYSVQLPGGFGFTNVARYEGDYIGRDTLSRSEKESLGIPVTLSAYREERRPDAWLVDWKLTWGRDIGPSTALQLELDVNNVFDREVETGTGAYERGRQVWLGTQLAF